MAEVQYRLHQNQVHCNFILAKIVSEHEHVHAHICNSLHPILTEIHSFTRRNITWVKTNLVKKLLRYTERE